MNDIKIKLDSIKDDLEYINRIEGQIVADIDIINLKLDKIIKHLNLPE